MRNKYIWAFLVTAFFIQWLSFDDCAAKKDEKYNFSKSDKMKLKELVIKNCPTRTATIKRRKMKGFSAKCGKEMADQLKNQQTTRRKKGDTNKKEKRFH